LLFTVDERSSSTIDAGVQSTSPAIKLRIKIGQETVVGTKRFTLTNLVLYI